MCFSKCNEYTFILDIRKRIESIQCKISQMENKLANSSKILVDKMTSAYGKGKNF